MGLKGQLNQNTCCVINKAICDLEAREKNIENYRDIIGKELPTLELMNTYCTIHKVFIRNRDLNPTKKYQYISRFSQMRAMKSDKIVGDTIR